MKGKSKSYSSPGKTTGRTVVRTGGPGKMGAKVTPRMSGASFQKGGKPC